MLDHEVKRKGDRGRYAIGAQHKLGAVSGAAYKLNNMTPFAVGTTGHSELVVVKDRHGQVRRHRLDSRGVVGVLVVGGGDDTHVRAAITNDACVPARTISHTVMLAKDISEKLQEHPNGLPTKTAIKDLVPGNAQAKVDALRLLTEGGYVSAGKPYKVLKPYRGGDSD
jgi:hypothetical protein